MNQPASAYFMEERHDPNEAHTLSVLVHNEPGVLARVIGLFSGRGYNIESLTVAEVDATAHTSRITIVTSGTPEVIEQIEAQIKRLVPVHRVVNWTVAKPGIEREMALVKVVGTGEKRSEAMRIAEVFRAGIQSVETGQIEAAKALGLSSVQRFRLVVFPQAIRTILPPLGNDFVAMVKDSSLVSVLGVADITQMGKIYASGSFRFFEVNPRIGRNNYYVTAAGANPTRFLVEDRVEGLAVEPVVVDREVLYSILPHRLLLRYVVDPALAAKVRGLIRARAVTHPLQYRHDALPRRRAYVTAALLNQVRKFRRYYPEVTSTGF